MCLYVLYKTCAGVNIDPMGQTFEKKNKKKKKLSEQQKNLLSPSTKLRAELQKKEIANF